MIYNTNCNTCEYQAGGHKLSVLRDFFLDFFDTNFGEALTQMTVIIYVRFPDDLLNRSKNQDSNRWLASKNLSQPRVRFLRDTKKLKIEYVTKVVGAEKEFEVDLSDAESFSNYCLEFIDILLKYLPKKIKSTDDFDLCRFIDHLKTKRAVLPIGEQELEQIKKEEERFDRRRLLKYFERTPPGKNSKRVPKLIPIQHLESNTPYVGSHCSGQFWGSITQGFSPLNGNTVFEQGKFVYAVLHSFNPKGQYIKTDWEKLPLGENQKSFQLAETKMKNMLDAYAPYKFGAIKIELFETNIEDMTFGLLNESDEEEAKVEMSPEGYMLLPPWNGYFDT